MMNKETAFSILIPSWNNLGYLRICVDSIKKNSAYRHQIIVHVNEGTDGTLEWVQSQGIDYTYSPTNIGVCLAMNTMRSKVREDYIYFVNDDMYLLPGWDKALAEEIEQLRGNKMFYLSSSTIQPKHAPTPILTGELADFGDGCDNFREEELLAHYKEIHTQDWQGATRPPCLVHKDVWDLVGGYSIEFSPGYGSDPDFSAKLYAIGVRHFKGLANSWAYHFESKTTSAVRPNDYRSQFLLKWGMKNRTFRTYVTRLGSPWGSHESGEKPSWVRKTASIWAGKLKAALYILRHNGVEAPQMLVPCSDAAEA